MKIWSDSHHSGLLRSLFLLLQDRLGHELWFPDGSFCTNVNFSHVGAWLPPNVAACGGIPERHLNEVKNLPNVCSEQQFMEMNWDAVIVSRPESVQFIRKLVEAHPNRPNIKMIGQAGNEGQYYDWGFIPNFLSSDYLSYERAPKDINKIHYMQEVGRQFQAETFTPLTEESLKTVNTFINCLDSFNEWTWDKDVSWWGGKCPHCDGTPNFDPAVSVYGLWRNMASHLPECKLKDYGINNTQGAIRETLLPEKILGGSLTWAFKTYEGMGHSIAQSISMGRLCLVPRRFHRYRTANQFLIPNLTCLEADWKAESCIEMIRWFTSDLNRANDHSEACFHAAKGLFNWKHEASRVKRFMDNLR